MSVSNIFAHEPDGTGRTWQPKFKKERYTIHPQAIPEMQDLPWIIFTIQVFLFVSELSPGLSWPSNSTSNNYNPMTVPRFTPHYRDGNNS
jgi:hypothetical protein